MSDSVATPSAGESDALLASRALCHEISRDRARNFYYGMKLVPEPKRTSMFALYAWMREADDLADAAGDDEGRREALERFRAMTHAGLAGEEVGADDGEGASIWPCFIEMVNRHEIQAEWLDDMIAGQLLDLEKSRYATFEELYDYCYKVASVVGLCCIEIWGYEGGEETRKLAEWRGIAFQLTNILRDVLEDAERDRVYVPAEDFNLFELGPEMFLLGDAEDAVAGLQKVADRAAEYYARSAPLDKLIHVDGRPCLSAMTGIYHGLLRKIQPGPAVVLSGKRVRLGSLRKGWIALRAVASRGRL